MLVLGGGVVGWGWWGYRGCGKGAERCEEGAESTVFRPAEDREETEAGGCSGQEVCEAVAEDHEDVRSVFVVDAGCVVRAGGGVMIDLDCCVLSDVCRAYSRRKWPWL